MRKITLDTIKECNFIETNGEDVLLFAKKLWLFRADGSYVCQVESARWPTKVVFLPDRTAFIDGGADGYYHCISLSDGKILWSVPQKGRRNQCTKRFALSQDHTFVYDYFERYTDDVLYTFIDRISLTDHTHSVFQIQPGLRVLKDIFVDSEDRFCTLQFHMDFDGKLDRYGNPTEQLVGIQAFAFHDSTVDSSWISQWKEPLSSSKWPMYCNGKQILRENLWVDDLKTGLRCPLVPEPNQLPRFSWAFYKEEKGLLITFDLSTRINAVIDCVNGRIAALYNQDSTAYSGNIVGNEFWLPYPDRVVRLPLPDGV